MSVSTGGASRRFIAHRGVNLGGTIAGENSLEAVRLARRAGFACVETDIRLTADGVPVVMHDETLDRTATDGCGDDLASPVHVAEVSFAQLRDGFRLKARDALNRTPVPTLEEYLRECAANGLLPFIEIKLHDEPPAFYRRVLAMADDILGHGGYVITSNGEANRIIRWMGRDDVPLMDIRHQAVDFGDVASLGDVTVAISTARYTREEHADHVAQARAAGLPTEAHADDIDALAIATAHGVDLISTDVLAPDLASGTRIALLAQDPDAFVHGGRWAEGELQLPAGAALTLASPTPRPGFGGLFLRMEFDGEAMVTLGRQRFHLAEQQPRRIRHQVLLDAEPASFTITASNRCRIRGLEVTVAEY